MSNPIGPRVGPGEPKQAANEPKDAPSGPKGRPNEPDLGPDLARFLRDWTELWREEINAQANDPDDMMRALLAGTGRGATASGSAAILDIWRSTLLTHARTLQSWASSSASPHVASSNQPDEPADPPGPQTSVAAPVARDAEVERLFRRVDELETRLAKLEAPRRRRG